MSDNRAQVATILGVWTLSFIFLTIKLVEWYMKLTS